VGNQPCQVGAIVLTVEGSSGAQTQLKDEHDPTKVIDAVPTVSVGGYQLPMVTNLRFH